MNRNILLTRLFGAFGLSLALGALLVGAPAHADASCVAPIASKTSQLQSSYLARYHVEMTIHREDVSLVEYSRGELRYDGYYGPIGGYSNQLFSDRYAGSQPFNYQQADSLSLYISANGLLHIRYNTWNFDTYWDLSCPTSNVMTARVPGVGVVTLTFRDFYYTIG